MNSGLPEVKEALLYGFVSVPVIDMNFLGILDIGSKSIILAIIAAIAQYLQLHFSFASSGPQVKSDDPAMEMTQNMMKNMKYIFPIMVFFISYKIAAVVALYWTVSSLFTLGQEIVVRRHLKQHKPL
jgi:YidC/Oxa1 family membrane protein insertase